MEPWPLTVIVPLGRRVAIVAVSSFRTLIEVPLPGADEVLQFLDSKTLRCSMVINHSDSAVRDGIRSGSIV